MKRFFSSILAFVMIICCTLSLTSCSNDEAKAVDKLVVYNWADYIYPEFEDDFKNYYRDITGREIEVTYVTFDTNETMITKITKGDSKIDVMCPSEYAIQKLMQMDSLVPMNYFSENVNDYINVDELNGEIEYVHNSNNIEQEIITRIEEGFKNLVCENQKTGETYTANMIDYMVPYMYGTLGILYNKEKFKELEIYDVDIMNKANWGILFNDSGERDEDGNIIPLSEGLTGTILMKDSIRDTYAATLFYLIESGKLDGLTTEDGRYYSEITSVNELINLVDDNIMKLCEEVLIAQKEELFGYEVDFGKDDLLKGNAYVDLAWSGDAIYAVEESWNDELNDGEGDYELAYYVPHTMGNIWFDGWVIPKTYDKSHETAIKLFINFLNTPKSAVENIIEIGYTPSVSAEAIKNDAEAMERLYEEYLVNPVHESEIEEISDDIYDEYDYASIEEFENYFFYNLNADGEDFDEIGGANWRYPFAINEDYNLENDDYKRTTEDLGMMRDFGNKNKDVVIMWNYVRSAGVSALPVFLIVMLSIAAAVGIVALCYYISYRKKLKVKLTLAEEKLRDNNH